MGIAIATLLSLVLIGQISASYSQERWNGAKIAFKKVYVGTIDVTADGDIVVEKTRIEGERTYLVKWHWARIDVSELDIENMPSVNVYVKLLTPVEGLPSDVWIEYEGYTPSGVTIERVAFIDGAVLIQFKYECFCNGELIGRLEWVSEYKIVVLFSHK